MESINKNEFQVLTESEMEAINGGKFWGTETTLSEADGLDRCATTRTYRVVWIGVSSESDSAKGDSTGEPYIYN